MAIPVTCECGQRFQAKDELQGKRLKCPKCGGVLTIPAPEPAEPQFPEIEPDEPSPAAENPFSGIDTGAAPPPFPQVAPASPRPTAQPSAAPEQPVEAESRGWITVSTGLNITFISLCVGAVGSAILGILILIAVNDPQAILMLFAGSGKLVGIILPWCFLAVFASFISLLTGWLVCCVVSERSGSRQAIRGAVGLVAVAMGLMVLMQLISALMTPSMPDFSQSDPAAMAEFQASMEKMQGRAETMQLIGKGFMWLVMLAMLGSYAAFGYFLGALGEYFGKYPLRQLALFFCGYQGAVALWFTLLLFVIDVSSVTMIKLILFVTIALWLGTYGWLLHLNREIRKLVERHT